LILLSFGEGERSIVVGVDTSAIPSEMIRGQ
jgi:hypothetical protein